MFHKLTQASKILIDHDYLKLIDQLTNFKRLLAKKEFFELFPIAIQSINDCIIKCECKYCASHYGSFLTHIGNRHNNGDNPPFWGPRILPNDFKTGSFEVGDCKIFKYVVDLCNDSKVPAPTLEDINKCTEISESNISIWCVLHNGGPIFGWKEKLMNMIYSEQCSQLYPMIYKMILQANEILSTKPEYDGEKFTVQSNFNEWFKVDGFSLLVDN
jgi:hypothetical protein